MPRNGSGVYSLPAGSLVTDSVDDILASQHNTPLTDLQTDMNTVRPIVAGGTGASSASGARTALGLGTLATQNEGTAAGEFRDNAANEALFSSYASSPVRFVVENGDLAINQGASTSGSGYSRTSVPSSPKYTPGPVGADRWYPTYRGSSAMTFAVTANTAAIGLNTPASYMSITSAGQVGVTDYGFYAQRIESARKLAGKTVTFFNWMKRATAGNVAFYVRQNFGTGGSPSADVTTYVGQNAITTSWDAYRFVAAIPSVAGKTFGTNGDDYIEIVYWISAGSAYNSITGSLGLFNTTVDFYGMHERVGDVPIEAANYYQPPDPQAELARCQRYFGAYENCMRVSMAAPLTGQMTLPVTMRAIPTISNVTYSSGSGASFLASKTSVIQTTTTLPSANAAITGLWADAEL